MGIRLPPLVRACAKRRPRECYARRTLARIGRAHGEGHLALVLRLIVESEGNAAELRGETISAVSAVLLAGVEPGAALFEAFDRIDLGALRAWAKASSTMPPAASMTAVLLWQLRDGPARVAELAAVARGAREHQAAGADQAKARRRRAVRGQGKENVG